MRGNKQNHTQNSYVWLFAFAWAFSLPESRRCLPIPLNLKEASPMGLQSEKGFLSHREQNSVSGYQPRRMSWHIPPPGAELFCVLSGLEAAGGRESSVQRSLSPGGWKSSQAAGPANSVPSYPGEGWEAEIPEDGCPNNRRGSSGQLGPCRLGQGLFLRPGRWEGDGSPRGMGCSPMEWSSFRRVIAPGASGSSQRGPWRGHLT